MLKACLFLLLVIPATAFCQNSGYIDFAQNKKVIDVICQKIDNDTTLVNTHVEFSKDDSSGFIAEGFCFVDKPKKEIKKFMYKGYEDSTTVETFYYFKKTVIKVLNGNQVYYYTDSLRDKSGTVLPAALSQHLQDVAALVNQMKLARVTNMQVNAFALLVKRWGKRNYTVTNSQIN